MTGFVMTGFVYCIEAVNGSIAKVGSSSRPDRRMGHLSSFPFALRFRHCLRLETIEEAAAWESFILARATRYRTHGEWVVVDKVLDDLFAQVTDATPMDFNVSSKGRAKPSESLSKEAVAKAILKRKFGPVLAAEALVGASDDALAKETVRLRIADGYGTDDIVVLDKIERHVVAAHVRALRDEGWLASQFLKSGVAVE